MALKDFHRERVKIYISELTKFAKEGTVIVDQRRSRPRWFDGRFLKAADLNRESQYFLSRQADLAVAAGTGVVEGLTVTLDTEKSDRIHIAQGHGMTFDGERVFLPRNITINLYDIPLSEELNVKLGLSRKPSPPDRTRSGIYIIALRPFEFTANPTSSYPVDIDGQRRFRDGDIVEGTAITLIPYSYPAGFSGSAEIRRSVIAHEIFAKQSEYQMPGTTLPLAMVEIRRGRVLWLDNYMVRRDMGSVHSDVLGFGFAPRHLRRSHFKQYNDVLEDIVAARKRRGTNLRFAATDYFPSLPSAGKLPAQSVDIDTFTQYFFPDVMDVEMSIIPEDELALLVEESLLLPPFLFDENEHALSSNSVMILLPVSRNNYYSIIRKIKKVPESITFPQKKIQSRLTPKDYLNQYRQKLPDFQKPIKTNDEALEEAAWKSLLGREELLWFVRRRNLSYKDEIAGTAVHVMTNEFTDERNMRRYLKRIRLDDNFTELKRKASAAADLEMVRLLTIPKFPDSEILMRAAIGEYENLERLDELNVAKTNLRFSHHTFGNGIDRLAKHMIKGTGRTKQKMRLAQTLKIPELDGIGSKLAEEEIPVFGKEVHELLVSDKNPDEIGQFILNKKEELEK